MNNTYVTLFNINYVSRGLTLYESLLDSCKEFVLYIIAFDDECFRVLRDLKLENVIVISLNEFEDDELLRVKSSRNIGEYCWTSTPKSIQYIFEHYDEEICTYIDADLMFFDDPGVLIEEIPDEKSVMITEHRYSDYCDLTNISGVYCVQYMTFKNNEKSSEVLKWWKNRCLENCCVDPDRGLCGDQKYLDDWLERFDCVYVMQNQGGGVAPWNANQYTFCYKNERVWIKGENCPSTPLVFFHFHDLTFFDKGVVSLTGGNYNIPDSAVAYIYKRYIRAHDMAVQKYDLLQADVCTNKKHFRDDTVDNLRKDRNYYLVDLFL